MKWENDVEITGIHPHAIAQFRKRTGCKKDDAYIQDRLLKLAEKATRAKFSKPKYELLALINHKDKADYLIDKS